MNKDVLAAQVDYKNDIEVRDAILRLEENKDFQLVIKDNFLEKNCARLTRLSTSLHLQESQRNDALKAAQAAGYLEQFLQVAIQRGDLAEKNLAELNQGDYFD